MAPKQSSLALVTFALSLAYAVARYHVAGTVGWGEFPVFVMNKAVSLTSLAFFAFSYRAGKTRWIPPGSGRFFGVWGFVLLNLHLGLTALAWDDSHYGKLFEYGSPKLASNLAMLGGAMAVAAFCAPMWATGECGEWRWWKPLQAAGYIGLALTAAHVGFIGFGGWWTPSAWPAYLPPITLISLVFALWPIARRRLS